MVRENEPSLIYQAINYESLISSSSVLYESSLITEQLSEEASAIQTYTYHPTIIDNSNIYSYD